MLSSDLGLRNDFRQVRRPSRRRASMCTSSASDKGLCDCVRDRASRVLAEGFALKQSSDAVFHRLLGYTTSQLIPEPLFRLSSFCLRFTPFPLATAVRINTPRLLPVHVRFMAGGRDVRLG